MTAPTRVALVATEETTRSALADYLSAAGFEVHAYDELSVPSSFDALVLIGDHDSSSDSIAAVVRSWIKLTKAPTVVVVTSKPKALAALVEAHRERLQVLPAPAFGWDVVDTLRAGVRPRAPRGA
jgi:hypothetical protein